MKTTKRILPITLLGTLAIACHAQVVTNGDFESPQVPATLAIYFPTNATWTWNGQGGIISPPGYVNGASFQAPAAPSGSQLAFLQGSNSFMSQVIVLPSTGVYNITYQDAGRPRWPSGAGGDTTYRILLDSNLIAQVSTTTGQPFTQETFTFTNSAGPHELKFQIVWTANYDETAFFDVIGVTPVQVGPVLQVNMYAGIQIFGTVGTSNRIEYVTNLADTNWIALTNIILTQSPYLIFDLGSPG